MTANDNGDKDMGNASARPRRSPLRTLRSVAVFLLFFAAIALSIALFATSPWMRVSPDCSVVCVFANDLKEFF